MGQGLFQKVAQVAAEEFGIGLDRVHITATSTDKVPNTSATAASSGTDLNGMAVQTAAREIKARLIAFRQRDLERVRGSHLVPRRSGVHRQREHPVRRIDQEGLCARASHLSAAGFYKTPKLHWDRDKGKGRPFFYFAYGAACSEVAIDILTGEMKVRRVDILHDVGRSINPAIDIGQIEGGFVQGMGWLTTEELVYDDKGRLLTHAPSTYKIPVASDVPADFRVALFDGSNREDTIYRSKAVGEPPLMLAISVFAAIADAIHSVHPGKPVALDAPATPEAILKAVGPVDAVAALAPLDLWSMIVSEGAANRRDGNRLNELNGEGLGPHSRNHRTARRCRPAQRGRRRRLGAARDRRAHRAAAGRRFLRHHRRRPAGIRGDRRGARGACGRPRQGAIPRLAARAQSRPVLRRHGEDAHRDVRHQRSARRCGASRRRKKPAPSSTAEPRRRRRPDRAHARAARSGRQVRRGGAGGASPKRRSASISAKSTTPVLLFGAGHVGRAVVLALAPLPFAVRWIDSRAGSVSAIRAAERRHGLHRRRRARIGAKRRATPWSSS